MGFQKPGKPPAKKKSRYAGVKSAGDQTPLLGEGDCVLKWVGTETGTHPKKHNQWVRVTFEIVSGEALTSKLAPLKPGDTCVLIETVAGGESATYGVERLKSQVVAFSGCDGGDEEYDAIDPDGEFMSAVLEGESNDYSGFTLEGRLARVNGRRGKEKTDKDTGKPLGEYFCSHKWEIIADDEQDVPSLAAQIELASAE